MKAMMGEQTGYVAVSPPFAEVVTGEGVIAASQLFTVWPESVGRAAPAQAGGGQEHTPEEGWKGGR